jgi:uncharacterized protein
VLLRTDTESDLGKWSYEVIDTKLARDTRAGTVMQLGLYSAMLGNVQGTIPERFHVVVPGIAGSAQVKVSLRVDDYSAYFRLLQRELLRAAEIDPDELAESYYPEPVEHCPLCSWSRQCDEKRHADDHLSLVAGLGRLHRRELTSHDISTWRAWPRWRFRYRSGRGGARGSTFAREQALVQL